MKKIILLAILMQSYSALADISCEVSLVKNGETVASDKHYVYTNDMKAKGLAFGEYPKEFAFYEESGKTLIDYSYFINGFFKEARFSFYRLFNNNKPNELLAEIEINGGNGSALQDISNELQIKVDCVQIDSK